MATSEKGVANEEVTSPDTVQGTSDALLHNGNVIGAYVLEVIGGLYLANHDHM